MAIQTRRIPRRRQQIESLAFLVMELYSWARNLSVALNVVLLALIFLSDVSFTFSTNASVGVDPQKGSSQVNPSAQPSGVIIPIMP